MLKVIEKRVSLPRRVFRRAALEIAYQLISLVVYAGTLGGWRAWCRNSLALGYCSENSDLDLTLYSSTQNCLPHWLKVFAGQLSWIGEWTAYSAADRAWAAIANPFELGRDPRLARALGGVREARGGEALAFWLRMSDGDSWLRSVAFGITPVSRRRKWDFHLRQLRLPAPKSDFPGYIAEIRDSLTPRTQPAGGKRQACLRPHAWPAEAIRQRMNIRFALEGQPPEWLDVSRAQARWEIWGLLGIVRLRGGFENVRRHLYHVIEAFPPGDPVRAEWEGFQRHLARLGSAFAGGDQVDLGACDPSAVGAE